MRLGEELCSNAPASEGTCTSAGSDDDGTSPVALGMFELMFASVGAYISGREEEVVHNISCIF